MKDPTFLLQAGPYMKTEKMACMLSSYPSINCGFDSISKLDPASSVCKLVPVGTVEFVREYCSHVGLSLPVDSFTYFFVPNRQYLHRKVRKGLLKDAKDTDFVKPTTIKLFTGDIKSNLDLGLDPETDVWISDPVEFESEFRFYVQDTFVEPEILGWSRYDPLPATNPDPDIDLVREIAQDFHRNLGPNAYTVDIGWRKDLGRYSLVEINDGWSIGYYNNTDPQSKPPTKQQYADMLVTRWRQIVFCNIF